MTCAIGFLHPDKYGNMALVFSYFLPVVRHIIPYLMGLSKMPFTRYALFSYSTGLLWTLIYFVIGHYFGNYIEEIASGVTVYGRYILLGVALTVIIWFGRNKQRRRSSNGENICSCD